MLTGSHKGPGETPEARCASWLGSSIVSGRYIHCEDAAVIDSYAEAEAVTHPVAGRWFGHPHVDMQAATERIVHPKPAVAAFRSEIH